MFMTAGVTLLEKNKDYALTGNWIDLENVTSCLRGSYSLRNRGCCPGADPDRIGSHNGLFGK